MYKDARIISVTSTTTATTLGTLVRAAIKAKSKELPNQHPLEVRLTPSADLAVSDVEYGDTLTVVSGTTKDFPFENALDTLVLLNAATVKVEMYFGLVEE